MVFGSTAVWVEQLYAEKSINTITGGRFLNTDISSSRSQAEYMQDVADIMRIRARGEKPLAMVHTYGCQQNVADGEKIKGQLAEMGFSFTEDPEEADLVLYNCLLYTSDAADE